MNEKVNINSNNIRLVGKVDQILPSFEANETTFGQLHLVVSRLSGAIDNLIVVYKASDREINVGDRIEVIGSVRTRNIEVNGKHKLSVYVYGTISDATSIEDVNEASIEGFIGRPLTKRETPFGRRVCDIVLANNSSYRKSYYIPVIAFNKLADIAVEFTVGSKVIIEGRLQSRTYNKRINDKVEERIAYEVSISSILSADLPDESKPQSI